MLEADTDEQLGFALVSAQKQTGKAQQPGVLNLVDGPVGLASGGLSDGARRSAVKVCSISANTASSRKAMRPIPSSAVSRGSGSARDRTPIPAAGNSSDSIRPGDGLVGPGSSVAE